MQIPSEVPKEFFVSQSRVHRTGAALKTTEIVCPASVSSQYTERRYFEPGPVCSHSVTDMEATHNWKNSR